MSGPFAYVHPGLVPLDRVHIDPSDAGFVWGAIVTDRLRTFGGRLFRLAEHLRRFRESCRLAHVPLVPTDEQISDLSNDLVSRNLSEQSGELSLIWLATPGRKSGMAWWPDGRLAQFIAYTENLSPLHVRKLHAEGVRLRTYAAVSGVDPRIKHRSRLAWWIAVQEVYAADPEGQPLLLDPASGHVLETPTANIVLVLDGVVTSPPSGTVLEGVSLGVIHELCQSLGIPFAERAITVADLERATEVLLTNTTYCVAGVSRVNDCSVRFPGPILNRLLDAWSELVGVNVRMVES